MPDKVTSAKTGKTYEVPDTWSDQEVDDYIKGQEKSFWDKFSAPLTTKPSEVGAKVEHDITEPSLSDADHPYSAMARGFIGGASKGVGDLMSSLTSPLSLGALAASGGSSLAENAGMESLAAAGRMIPKAIGAATAGHGALNTLQGIREGNLGKIGSGGVEMATGAAGLHAPALDIQEPTPVESIKPSPVTDATGRVIAPPQSGPERPIGPWDTNAGNARPQFPVSDPLQVMKERADAAFAKHNAPMGKVDLLNASAVADQVNPNKVQIRLGKDGTYNLLNPAKDLDATIKAGYEPTTGALNEDGSLTVRQGKFQPKQVESLKATGTDGLNDVAPLSAPNPTAGIPSFKSRPLALGGGNNGGNLPPTQQPPLPFPEPLKNNSSITKSDIINLPRSAMAGADLSAPLRQGAFMITRPQFWGSLRPMMQAAMSEDGYNAIMQSIKSHPLYELAHNSGLSITDLNQLREEHIMSPLPERIPGPIGAIYRGSNRAYTAFLDKLRMDSFGSLAQDAMKSNLDMRKSGPAIANYVNAATGRGALPESLQSSAKAINGLFFSPKFMASRIRLLSPEFYINADPIVRKAAWRDLAGFTGTVMTTLGLAHMMGADVTIDPTNPDFGKLKVGNTRVDMLAGFGPYVKLFSQLAMMQKTSSVTGKVTKLNSGKFGGKTGLDAVNDFINSKEAPIPSFVSDALRGKETSGAPFSPVKGVAERLTPMMLQDFYDIYQDDPKHLPLAIPGVFGAGVQTYGSNNYQRQRSPNSIQRIH